MTDYLWDVFISHSTKSAPEGNARKLLLELVDRFPLGACRVQADQIFLHPGDRWEEKIGDRINESHFGIVLLDANALDSKWVRREVRQMLDQPTRKNYRIIAILVDLTRGQVQEAGIAEFTKLVEELQTLSIEAADSTDALRQLEHVLSLNVLAHLDEREMSLVRRLAYFLPSDPKMLEKMCGQLDENATLAPLLPREDLAYRILNSRLSMQVRAMFAGSSDELLSSVDKERRARLADLIEPSWIDFDSARRVIDDSPGLNRVCVLGTANPVPDADSTGICVATGKNFVHRATHWDRGRVRVEKAGDIPYGEPYEVAPLLRRQYRWNTFQTNYLVLEAGRSRSSRLTGVHAVQANWPDVVVVLVIGPDADPDEEAFRDHLGGNYCHTVVEHQQELDAIEAMEDIRTYLSVERQ
ncbi:toll/interleukin-1 receptor domain-containing protein [Lentzea sp. NPDC055074]